MCANGLPIYAHILNCKKWGGFSKYCIAFSNFILSLLSNTLLEEKENKFALRTLEVSFLSKIRLIYIEVYHLSLGIWDTAWG